MKKQESGDPADNLQLWKVEPGIALGFMRLGMPRDELFQNLKEHGFETEAIDPLDHEFYIMEMETTLYFGQCHPYPLELIEVDDERVRFGTLKVLWDFPHNIFATVPSTATIWFDDLAQITTAFTSPPSQTAATDEQLLDNGTLWMKALGVGFVLSRGKITSLLLCDPAQLPQTGCSEFSGAQRHLSERMQIESFKVPIVKTHPLVSGVKIGLLLSAILVAAFFGKQAWEEQKRWDNAPEVEATVVAVWPPPPEPFPDKYQLAFQDNSGKTHEVELLQNDLYGIPQVGEQIRLRYLQESPQTVKGPAKLHDIAFDRFVPYLLGIFATYFVLHFVSDYVVGRLLHKS